MLDYTNIQESTSFNSSENLAALPGFELTTLGSVARYATDCATEDRAPTIGEADRGCWRAEKSLPCTP